MEDLVFVLDRYDPFKPCLVGSHRQFDAMNTIDSEIYKSRGMLLLIRN